MKKIANGMLGSCLSTFHVKLAESVKAALRAREPWWLAGSPELGVLDAAAIIALSAKRMRSEPSFRDLKNERLGLGFSAARSHSATRLEIVRLIAHLTRGPMRLMGECAQQCPARCSGISRGYPVSVTRRSPCRPWPVE